MASNSVFQTVTERGWRAGFSNLLRKESRDWWANRRWLVRILVWVAILDGTLASVLFAPATETGAALLGGVQVLGLTIFFAVAGIALAIGVVIMGQEEVLDERRSGTAAWILSKPVSRVAFILSKLVANAIGIALIMVLLPGAVAFSLLLIATGTAPAVGGLLAALGVTYLAAMFYFTLALMLGTVSASRGAAIGIPLALLSGYQFVLSLAPWLGHIMPWGLTTPLANSGSSVALALALGQPVADATPVIATLVWCVVFIAIAMWRFNREEF